MGERRAIDTLQPVERELRFTLPYWSMVGVLVNEADEMPAFEGRPARKVVLDTPPGELTSAHVGARIERFRTSGVNYLVVPATVYPWLDRHPELRSFLRTQFRRIETDEDTCHLYALGSEDAERSMRPARTACPCDRPRWSRWSPGGSSRRSSSATASTPRPGSPRCWRATAPIRATSARCSTSGADAAA